MSVTLVLNYLYNLLVFFFFFNDTATTEIYTLSLHDALPIWSTTTSFWNAWRNSNASLATRTHASGSSPFTWKIGADRKSTRLNSSHANISYAVFCLKKKKKRRT